MKLEAKRILVTGAGGFIGSHLAEALAEKNEVLVVDDFSIGTRENLRAFEQRPGARVVTADINDLARMTELMRGIQVVYHLAISCLRTSLGQPLMSHDVNAGGTLRTCMAAHAAGVERFVYCSSSEVYGTALAAPMSEEHPLQPTTVYGASKLAGENYALAHWRTHGMPVIVVRPFNTYGPREPQAGARAEVIPRFTMQLLAGRQPVVYGDGRQTRDFTFVSETARGLVLAGECDALVGDVVNVAFGREVSILRIAELLMELTGTTGVGLRHEPVRPGDVLRHYADVSKARRLLGFHARIDIEEGLRRYLDWFRGEGVKRGGLLESAGRPNW
jgi:UDP-glucose 4-epimerase